MPQTEDQQPGFLVRWVLPIVFVLVVVAAFGFLGRMSVPALEEGVADAPEGHFTSACWVCHRGWTKATGP